MPAIHAEAALRNAFPEALCHSTSAWTADDRAALRRVLGPMFANEMPAASALRRRSDGMPAPQHADRGRAQSRSGALVGDGRRPHPHPARQSRRIRDAAHAGDDVVWVMRCQERDLILTSPRARGEVGLRSDPGEGGVPAIPSQTARPPHPDLLPASGEKECAPASRRIKETIARGRC
jgi:hypothetical protein